MTKLAKELQHFFDIPTSTNFLKVRDNTRHSMICLLIRKLRLCKIEEKGGRIVVNETKISVERYYSVHPFILTPEIVDNLRAKRCIKDYDIVFIPKIFE